MKTRLLLLLLMAPIALQAQDIIVKNDGSTIISKVLEVNKDDVKYKKHNNLNGPTYTIDKAEIMVINYENGDKDIFTPTTTTATTAKTAVTTKTPKPSGSVQTVPTDARCKELIERYNREHYIGPKFKKSNKTAQQGCFIMGVSEDSEMSNQDIEIQFVQKPYQQFYGGRKVGATNQWGNGMIMKNYHLTSRYEVHVVNKTDHTIYIDMANTFRVLSDGNSEAYYDATQTTVSTGRSVGGSVGLGGVTGGLIGGVGIGGSSSSSVSETFIQQRVMAIPPKGHLPLATHLDKVIGGRQWKNFSESENAVFQFLKEEAPAVTCGNYITYDADTAPFKAGFNIKYSHDENFTSSYSVGVKLYMKQLYGLKERMDVWNGSKDKSNLLKAIKEDMPDYDDYTIVGIWWIR